jgi:hypothetical protein
MFCTSCGSVFCPDSILLWKENRLADFFDNTMFAKQVAPLPSGLDG